MAEVKVHIEVFDAVGGRPEGMRYNVAVRLEYENITLTGRDVSFTSADAVIAAAEKLEDRLMKDLNAMLTAGGRPPVPGSVEA